MQLDSEVQRANLLKIVSLVVPLIVKDASEASYENITACVDIRRAAEAASITPNPLEEETMTEVLPDAQFNDLHVANQLDVSDKFSIGPDYIDFANAPVFSAKGILLPSVSASSVPADSRGSTLFIDSSNGKLTIRQPNNLLVVLG